MNEVIEVSEASTWRNRVRNAFANNKVRIGIAIAITAVVSALVARSDMFATTTTTEENFDADSAELALEADNS